MKSNGFLRPCSDSVDDLIPFITLCELCTVNFHEFPWVSLCFPLSLIIPGWFQSKNRGPSHRHGCWQGRYSEGFGTWPAALMSWRLWVEGSCWNFWGYVAWDWGRHFDCDVFKIWPDYLFKLARGHTRSQLPSYQFWNFRTSGLQTPGMNKNQTLKNNLKWSVGLGWASLKWNTAVDMIQRRVTGEYRSTKCGASNSMARRSPAGSLSIGGSIGTQDPHCQTYTPIGTPCALLKRALTLSQGPIKEYVLLRAKESNKQSVSPTAMHKSWRSWIPWITLTNYSTS